MSFILDALKKSEAERQRQSGPALMEVRLMPPRRRFPLWWIALSVLLGGNLWLLLWLGLRTPTHAASATASAATTPQAAAASVPVAVAPAPATVVPPPAAVIAPPAAASASLDAPAAGGSDIDDVAADNPSDLEPARAPASGSARRESSAQSLRSYSELSANLPDLRLDLHVYATKPADRYALINMHKVHEGEVLPEGPRVNEITRDGVVLEYKGDEFLLGRE